MLLNIVEAKQRLESPGNLMNRLAELRNKTQEVKILSIPELSDRPSIDDLVEGLDEKLGRSDIKSKANVVMNRCLAKLSTSIEELEVKKLAAIAKDMSLVIKNLEPENQNQINNNVQFVIHSPVIRNESEFDIVTSAD